MKLLKKKDLKDHDVYEICSAENYPNHWNYNSLFITMEDFSILSPYLDKVFSEYHYYGPQKVTISEWDAVKSIALTKDTSNECLATFFNEISNWINEHNSNHNHFWIYGI